MQNDYDLCLGYKLCICKVSMHVVSGMNFAYQLIMVITRITARRDYNQNLSVKSWKAFAA